MSLFSSIAQSEESQTRVSVPRGLWMFAIGVGLGLLLGYAVSSIDFATGPRDAAGTSVNVLTPEQFYQLNTEGFLPPAALATQQASVVDPFIWLNVDSYDDLLQMRAQRYWVDPNFLKINTEGLDWPAAPYCEPWSGPH